MTNDIDIWLHLDNTLHGYRRSCFFPQIGDVLALHDCRCKVVAREWAWGDVDQPPALHLFLVRLTGREWIDV